MSESPEDQMTADAPDADAPDAPDAPIAPDAPDADAPDAPDAPTAPGHQHDLAELAAIVEALLFLSQDPVKVKDLAEATDAEPSEVEEALTRIQQREGGIVLREVAGGWALASIPAAEKAARRLLAKPRTPPLTQAQAECLSIVAYLQPVSRPEIARIRGVASESAVATLEERGLIEDCGRSQFGAILYRTTSLFQRLFGLASLDALPDPSAFDPSPEEEGELRERLLRAGEIRAGGPNPGDGQDALPMPAIAATAAADAADAADPDADAATATDADADAAITAAVAADAADPDANASEHADATAAAEDAPAPAESFAGGSETEAEATDADRTGADRTGADRTGADRTGADRAETDGTGADRAETDRTGGGARVSVVPFAGRADPDSDAGSHGSHGSDDPGSAA